MRTRQIHSQRLELADYRPTIFLKVMFVRKCRHFSSHGLALSSREGRTCEEGVIRWYGNTTSLYTKDSHSLDFGIPSPGYQPPRERRFC